MVSLLIRHHPRLLFTNHFLRAYLVRCHRPLSWLLTASCMCKASRRFSLAVHSTTSSCGILTLLLGAPSSGPFRPLVGTKGEEAHLESAEQFEQHFIQDRAVYRGYPNGSCNQLRVQGEAQVAKQSHSRPKFRQVSGCGSLKRRDTLSSAGPQSNAGLPIQNAHTVHEVIVAGTGGTICCVFGRQLCR